MLANRINSITTLMLRSFGKSHLSHLERKERKWVTKAEYDMKDFTKSEQF